ncbi:glycoside hydrolase/deacetylase [Setomelanomma holmii]|uniref:Glycoside hydrolase/deacetylase n=1 Tax=Setomelanomma holmii TaxID=210430 RepID=A0A9P4LRB2_9PLEO|nr:glycoside hydrolase/deacetylase [Setomelanomma holmii]
MRFSTALAAVAAIAPLASAHGAGAALPRIVGLNPRDLKARDLLSSLGARFAEVQEFAKAEEAHHVKVKRQSDLECGASVGKSCAAGQCCSQSGYCGTDPDYCYSPGCDYAHGPGCPENVTPAGTNTSTIARTHVGSVAYGGAGIYGCVTAGTIALTYDDGPQKTFTAHILDLMATYSAKATFFITGNNINKGEIDTTQEFIDVIKRMDAEGHQIASHTWTHLDLSAISQTDRKAQMIKNEMALRNIVGKIPTYMRPPYSSCTGQCETDLAALGYHVIYFDVDTDDYEQDSPTLIQNSKNWFYGNITAGGATAAGGAKWLDIQHDIHEQTANNLTEYMLQTIQQLGYKAVTVGECLGDPVANWYRTADGAASGSSSVGTATKTSSAAASTGTKVVSTDATCGGTTGYTCLGSTFGNCCSTNGWCGSTTDYCGTGCQSGFGNCGSNSPVSSTPKAASSTKASSAAASPSAGAKVSTDGTCAGTNGFTCTGSSYGNCCSQYGWCGSTTDHCSTGCNSAFGTCSGSAASSVKAASSTPKAVSSTKVSSSAAATATKKASTDGTCAGTYGYTCTGSTFGNCCSQYGWCGSTTDHCGTGCNKTYGTCT